MGKGGGGSDAKANEKKAIIMYALNDVRAAVEEGIAPGAGCTPLQCIPALALLKLANEEQKV